MLHQIHYSLCLHYSLHLHCWRPVLILLCSKLIFKLWWLNLDTNLLQILTWCSVLTRVLFFFSLFPSLFWLLVLSLYAPARRLLWFSAPERGCGCTEDDVVDSSYIVSWCCLPMLLIPPALCCLCHRDVLLFWFNWFVHHCCTISWSVGETATAEEDHDLNKLAPYTIKYKPSFKAKEKVFKPATIISLNARSITRTICDDDYYVVNCYRICCTVPSPRSNNGF